jgi:hypothetical protein
MKTYTPVELKEILRLHKLWLNGDSKGIRADLSESDLRGSDLSESDLRGSDLSESDLRGSDLRGSNLSGSNLRNSNLSGSNLSGSNLSGSNLSNSNLRKVILPYGETWEQYLAEVVPNLLKAGGKDISEIVKEAWDCHNWDNCPMACAFSVKSEGDTPLLLRPRVQEFVRFFDAKLIPKPTVK